MQIHEATKERFGKCASELADAVICYYVNDNIVIKILSFNHCQFQGVMVGLWT